MCNNVITFSRNDAINVICNKNDAYIVIKTEITRKDKHFTSYKVIIKNVVNNLHFACDYTRANGEPIELIEFDSYDNIEFMQIEGLNGN